jgi:hypothetical protein
VAKESEAPVSGGPDPLVQLVYTVHLLLPCTVSCESSALPVIPSLETAIVEKETTGLGTGALPPPSSAVNNCTVYPHVRSEAHRGIK